MNTWNKTRKEVFASQVFDCVFCGAKCAWHTLKSGNRVPVAVNVERESGRYGRGRERMTIVTGAGNHKNFVPIHDCRGEAARMLPEAERRLKELEGCSAEAIKSVLHHLRECVKERRDSWPSVPVIRKTLRDSLAKSIRASRKQVREQPANIKSAREYRDFLLERATCVAVYESSI